MRKKNAAKLPKKGVSEKIRRLSDRLPLSPETRHAARTAGEIGGHLGAIFATSDGAGSHSMLGILGHIVALIVLGARWVLKRGSTNVQPPLMKRERLHGKRKDG